jgi:hypothetical protein
MSELKVTGAGWASLHLQLVWPLVMFFHEAKLPRLVHTFWQHAARLQGRLGHFIECLSLFS